MKRFVLIITGLLLALHIIAHPWKPSHYLIVDTDGGIDDMKTISMLLASKDIRVLAITVSPGSLTAENAFIKVRSLLNSFWHEGIPVGINRSSRYKSREFSVALGSIWGNETGIDPVSATDCYSLISNTLTAEETKISFICLGSMSTAYNSFRSIPVFREKVKGIIWSADGEAEKQGFNYNIDKDASIMILRQDIPLKIIRKFDQKNTEFYDKELINALNGIRNIYAEKVTMLFNSEPARNHKLTFGGYDEMVAIFLHYPDLFINKVAGNISYSYPADVTGLREALLNILAGKTTIENQVIKQMPEDPEFYFDDIKPYVNEIIKKHGPDEWVSSVIANELHRHLGVYSTIGVKMGIRAREYFNIGADEFFVVSFAGSIPPLSCMNDGLQVSTGATPGHGLMLVRNDTIAEPSAEITYLNRKIRISLKPEIKEIVSSEIKEIEFIYGLDSDIYWELVRKNSLKYWLHMDRHNIFNIEVID